MSDLTSFGLVELRKGLDLRNFSSEELTMSYLSRIEANQELNSFIEVCSEHALVSAREADKKLTRKERAPLLGIPVAVKDVIVTQGIQTTCGSKILSSFVPPYDATVVNKIKTAGGFTIGKTNMDEFAMGSSNENSAYGPVRNPWDKTRVPGGSSGGSAVAVAAKLSSVALGTDTGGSIRQPASLCGIVGLKPTYGRVSRYGLVAFASSLDQIGVFSRSVRDCAYFLNIICGQDPLDSTSVKRDEEDFQTSLEAPIKGLRIGIPEQYFIKGMSAEVENVVKAAISKIESLGANVVSINLPHTDKALSVYYIVAPAEASSNLARFDGVRYGHRTKNAEDLKEMYFRSRAQGFGSEVKRRIMIGTYVLSTGYYDAYYLRAQKVRTLITQDFRDVFKKQCDLIACPVSPTTAFRIGEKTNDPLSMYLSDIFTIPVNLAGLPGMSVPCGFDSLGLPVGLQLIGKPWDEATILKVAHAYEQATDWHRKQPPL